MNSAGQMQLRTGLIFNRWIWLCCAIALLNLSRLRTKDATKSNLREITTHLVCWIDEHLMVYSLENLLNNAMKYSAEGTSIELGLWLEGDRIHIRIKDQWHRNIAARPGCGRQGILPGQERIPNSWDRTRSGICQTIYECHTGKF